MIKKFTIKFGNFIINLALLFIILFPFLFYILPSQPLIYLVGAEVNEAQTLSTETNLNKNDTIRLGDSVGKNINEVKGFVNHSLNLTCNQAISMLGHLMLINQALSNNPKIDSIVIEGYFRPSSFFNNLDQQWTNNYFIKKFYNSDWFFNDQLCYPEIRKFVDSVFLSQYQPYANLINKTWYNNKTIFGVNAIGFNKGSKQDVQLFDILNHSEFKSVIRSIKFKSIPIHPDKYQAELDAYLRLKALGVNIEAPKKTNERFFIDDNIHLKKEFRNIKTYRKIMSL